MGLPAQCLNCGQDVDSKISFCSRCGQKTSAPSRLNLAYLIHEAVHYFTHADKGIFYLIRKLPAQPGHIAREYILGRRKKIFSPLNFFLISIALYVFVHTTFQPMQGGVDLTEVKQEVMELTDVTVRERRLIKLERQEKASAFMSRNSNIINFIVTPLLALLFYAFFRKRGFNYTEHLVANLYFAGFNALVFVFIIAPYLILTKGSPAYFLGIAAILLFDVFYRSIGYYQLMERKGSREYMYCLFVSFLGVFAWMVISVSMIFLYVNTGFGFW